MNAEAGDDEGVRLPSPIRRIARITSIGACLSALSLMVAGGASAAQVLFLEDPVTDNYKASYNADPSRTELRT